jgi:glycosyltransferase involved in cell wall biosynthesis
MLIESFHSQSFKSTNQQINMRVGFDAKRAFLNKSGLGSYSRNLISALCSNFTESEFMLYTTRTNPDLFNPFFPNIRIRIPETPIHRRLHPVWRSFGIPKLLIHDEIDIFHGLSHELPFRFPSDKVKSVVTIHDLIYMRIPGLYSAFDRTIYERKTRYACRKADRIIAISQQTADDIVEFFGTNRDKIEVICQGCHPGFYQPLSPEEKTALKAKYGLPASYILYVGTIEKRKNLLSLLRALTEGNIEMPLVVIGRKKGYAAEVFRYLEKHRSIRVFFHDTIANTDLPGFYQLAEVFVYPSVYEGFGIPILEALASRTPVITSRGGCFSEAGGPSTLYVDPMNARDIAEAINRVIKDPELREKMTENGFQHAYGFRQDEVAGKVMNIYKKILQNA